MKIPKMFLISLLFFFEVESGNWCKAIYNKNVTDGEIKSQIKKCRNSDNFFLAIDSSYQNSGHLTSSFVAKYCDLRRQIVKTTPRDGDPYFTVVCEFRRNNLRK